MLIQPDPIYAELFARQERDRTLRKSEEYELRRAVQELRDRARAERRAARTVRTVRPRSGHRRPVIGRLRATLRHV